MNVGSIKNALEARVIVGDDKLDTVVEGVYASDLMSDVLAYGKPNSILLTGLPTQQAIISAHMAEFVGVVLIRGKRPKDGSARFAREYDMILLSTKLDMYDACVMMNGLESGVYVPARVEAVGHRVEEMVLSHEFAVEGADFANAGTTSTEVKSILKKIGLNPELIRRVAISTYEGEMNVVMHARRATVTLTVSPTEIDVTVDDVGKGIPDVELAMQEGYSTATEEMRAIGFGAGMGLANIKRNTDSLKLDSVVGKGTKLKMKFKLTGVDQGR